MLRDPDVLGVNTVPGVVCVNKLPLFSQWTPLLASRVFLVCLAACVHAKSLQLCPTPYDPMDCSLPGSSVHGIHQARILQRVAMPSSRGSSPLRDRTCVSCLAGGSFIAEPLGNPD